MKIFSYKIRRPKPKPKFYQIERNSWFLVCNIFMLRQKMHLWITEESKKTKICKNGSVYSVKGQECSKSKHRKEDSLCDPQECEDNKNILCQCSQKCNLNECYKNKTIYDDGCECRDPKVRTIRNFSSALLHFCICESFLKMCILDLSFYFFTSKISTKVLTNF